MFILPLALSSIIFWKPRIFYERQDDSYVIRYYTFGLVKNDKILKIPSTYKDKPIVGIRGDVFKNVFTIEKVILPETIEEIRGGAFMNAYNLKEINLPTGIKEIKGDTFRNCKNLDNIIIPEGVYRIGGSAFRNCRSLSNVIIPQSVKEIGSSAFRSTALNKVCINDNAYVNSRAFKDTNAVIVYYKDKCKYIDKWFRGDYYVK